MAIFHRNENKKEIKETCDRLEQVLLDCSKDPKRLGEVKEKLAGINETIQDLVGSTDGNEQGMGLPNQLVAELQSEDDPGIVEVQPAAPKTQLKYKGHAHEPDSGDCGFIVRRPVIERQCAERAREIVLQVLKPDEVEQNALEILWLANFVAEAGIHCDEDTLDALNAIVGTSADINLFDNRAFQTSQDEIAEILQDSMLGMIDALANASERDPSIVWQQTQHFFTEAITTYLLDEMLTHEDVVRRLRSSVLGLAKAIVVAEDGSPRSWDELMPLLADTIRTHVLASMVESANQQDSALMLRTHRLLFDLMQTAVASSKKREIFPISGISGRVRPEAIRNEIRRFVSATISEAENLLRFHRDLRIFANAAYGDPNLSEERRRAFDSMRKRRLGSQSAALTASYFVLLLAEIEEEDKMEKLSKASGLSLERTREIIRAIGTQESLICQQICWFFQRGESEIFPLGLGKGSAIPKNADVAWSPSSHWAYSLDLNQSVREVSKLWASLGQLFLSDASELAEEPTQSIKDTASAEAQPQNPDSSRDRIKQLPMRTAESGARYPLSESSSEDREISITGNAASLIKAFRNILLSAEAEKEDPRLALYVMTDVVTEKGALTWKRCLELANIRAPWFKYYKTLPGECKVALWISPPPGHELPLEYAAKVQRLMPYFGLEFDKKDLFHQVLELWDLVWFARDPHKDEMRIGPKEIERQIDRRMDELWNYLQRRSEKSANVRARQ